MSNDTQNFYSSVGENIRKIRLIKNMSLQEVAEKVGLTKKAIQRYETGETKIDMFRLTDIAKALEVDMESLLDGTYKFLGIDESNIKLVNIPIIGKVSCGSGVLAIQDVEGYEPTPKEWINGGEYVYVRATGDSMIGARICDGDLVLIRRQPEVEDGEIAAVVIDDQTYLKRVYRRDGTIILQSENSNYPPIICNKNCFILGKLKKIIISN